MQPSTAVGIYLNRVMGLHDSVALEPLGYIGWYAGPNKIIFDFPGLSSDLVTRTLDRLPVHYKTIEDLINALHPTYLVLRPKEMAEFQGRFPALARQYQVIRVIVAAPGLKLRFHGLIYDTIDNKFFVLKHLSPQRSPRSGTGSTSPPLGSGGEPGSMHLGSTSR